MTEENLLEDFLHFSLKEFAISYKNNNNNNKNK